HKDHYLVVPLEHFLDLVESHVVEIFLGLLGSRLALDSDEVLLQGHRAEGGVKVEEAGVSVDLEEDGDSDIVGQRGTEASDANQRLRAVHLALGSSDERLKHGTALIVEHVHFIDNQKPDLLDQLRVARALPRNYIPLLRRGDNNLRLHNLRLGQLHVSG